MMLITCFDRRERGIDRVTITSMATGEKWHLDSPGG